MNARHAFEMLMLDLKAQTEQATQDRVEKLETNAKTLQANADADGGFQGTITKSDDDQSTWMT